MTAGLSEVRAQDPELADRSAPGHCLVGIIDGGLDLRDQLGVVGKVGWRGAGRLAVLQLPEVKSVGIERDQAGDERPVVADNHALADQRLSPEPVL